MKKYLMCSILCICILTAKCRTLQTTLGFVKAIADVVELVSLVKEGVSSLTFFSKTDLEKTNELFNKSGVPITLEDTYMSAYGKKLKDVGEDGETGDRFMRMKIATGYFQRVLKQYGVQYYDRYILTSIDTAKGEGLVLFAVVFRPVKSIEVHYKFDGEVRKFDFNDRLFYEPYIKDVNGKPLDTIIDYGGIHSNNYTTQKMQAILMTLAANSIVMGKMSPDYWGTEMVWIAGGYDNIMEEKNQQIQNVINSRLKPITF